MKNLLFSILLFGYFGTITSQTTTVNSDERILNTQKAIKGGWFKISLIGGTNFNNEISFKNDDIFGNKTFSNSTPFDMEFGIGYARRLGYRTSISIGLETTGLLCMIDNQLVGDGSYKSTDFRTPLAFTYIFPTGKHRATTQGGRSLIPSGLLLSGGAYYSSGNVLFSEYLNSTEDKITKISRSSFGGLIEVGYGMGPLNFALTYSRDFSNGLDCSNCDGLISQLLNFRFTYGIGSGTY